MTKEYMRLAIIRAERWARNQFTGSNRPPRHIAEKIRLAQELHRRATS